MGPPIRKGGVAELRPSIPHTCLASPMTVVSYSRLPITAYRTEDTTGRNLIIHALSICVVQLPPSYPIRFPDCVGLVPDSTAATLRTVKALDIGPSSRSMGHIGSADGLHRHSPVISHHTSIFDIGTSLFPHLSHIRMVTPLNFYFISRLEDDQLKLPCASCNRRFKFVRIFPSHLGILFYSARLIRNRSIPNFEDISIPSLCGPAFSFPVSISHVIFTPLLTVRPCSPASVVRGCLSSAHLAGTTAVSVGRICGCLLHRCIRRSSNLYMVCIAHPLSVFVCFLDMLPSPFPLRRVCACFARTLAA